MSGDFSLDKVPVKHGESADPATSAASIVVYACPAGKHAVFISAHQRYVRDANAQDVLAALLHDDGTNEFGRWPLSTYLTASATWRLSWAAGAASATIGAFITGGLPLPGIQMIAGDRIVANWFDDQVGDDGAKVYFVYKEWPI